jgi:hypothetical protein
MKATAAEPRTVTIYTDYKSPYAYLAKDLVYELERDFPVRIDWLPYRLDIPSFLGSARLDDNGRVIEEVYKRAGSPHYTSNPVKNLILFSYLPTQSASTNLP